MNTTLPPSDTPEQPDFNGFGSYRRKRKGHGAEHAVPRRSFRRIPQDKFREDSASGDADGTSETGNAGQARPRPFRKFGGKKPSGKKPFGKKPFGKKKPFGHGGPDSEADRFPFRDFADTIDEGDVPPPHRDRSFKHSGGFSSGTDDGFSRHRKPYGEKPHGKKPFGKFRPFRKERSHGEDGDGEAPRPPRAIRRPYGMSGAEIPFDETPLPHRKPFRKPFGKKPFGKKPFGKKPSGKKPFTKGKPSGKKPSGKPPFGKGKPFGKKPFSPKRPPFRG